ncbi:TetR/AcrR family transcriptional regulator [Bacillus sp. BGMRC 2118]|nr:TetR/AcrR family transcriptional regulator [Bacillus sp. BGMRC 2118]
MNNRKQHVLIKAHQLFIEKGFQATSIQDILEFSSISKGTFYNYFSSKNELLIAIFSSIYKKLEKDRDALLVSQDPSDVSIFIKQIELQMKTNRENQLITLFEEVSFLNAEDLKQAIKKAQLRYLIWIYKRFIELFGEEKKPYLFDCAVMFSGILHHNMRYYALAYKSQPNIEQVVQYSVQRIQAIVEDVSESKEQLLRPELIESWMPNNKKERKNVRKNIIQLVFTLKEFAAQHPEQKKHIELLEFIQEELTESKHPRTHLINISIHTLKADNNLSDQQEFKKLEELIATLIKQD